MWKWIKQLFCEHEFRSRRWIGTRYDSNGERYRVYRSVCTKCGKVVYEEVLL